MNVQIFIPCFIDQLYPETGFNMIKVLEKAGCTVHYNPNQTCCGQPAFNAGFVGEARDIAAKCMHDFAGNSDYIVGPSASCVGFIKNYYPRMFDNATLQIPVRNMGNRVYEFSSFLTDVLKVEDLGASFHAKVTYHDSCAALRECKIKEGPRKLLSNVKGLELVEMENTETCCGFGGTFAVKFEPISMAMVEQKVQNALKTGASCIVSTDLSCLMHIKGYIQQHQLPLQTMHLADILAMHD
jgi:L-lactate dehydrogenase complex protein LldE